MSSGNHNWWRQVTEVVPNESDLSEWERYLSERGNDTDVRKEKRGYSLWARKEGLEVKWGEKDYRKSAN